MIACGKGALSTILDNFRLCQFLGVKTTRGHFQGVVPNIFIRESTRGGSGMGFFRDPKSRDKNPGILGFLSQKNPKSENPTIPGFFGIGIDFFGISPGFLKISNSTSKMIVLYFRSINGIFC